MYAVIVAKRITAHTVTAPGLTAALQRSVVHAQTPMDSPQLTSVALRPQLFPVTVAVPVAPPRPLNQRKISS